MQMYLSHVQHIVFVLQSFFGGRIGISSPQVDKDKIAFTSIAEAAVRGRRSLL
jgi:hypothetical protein